MNAPCTAAEITPTLGDISPSNVQITVPLRYTNSGSVPCTVTTCLTTAPGDTTVMTLPFPATVGVQRQDGATRPASYIGAFSGPVD
ncbi:hypothetical protein ACIGGF_19905 [Rhodococcus sp. NPDC078407]|uniref:hypothetical protein n=1 Tax=Rhodococcus sp. NPDC078407 TaxID=3364509 RepID=UPI0037CA88D6